MLRNGGGTVAGAEWSFTDGAAPCKPAPIGLRLGASFPCALIFQVLHFSVCLSMIIFTMRPMVLVFIFKVCGLTFVWEDGHVEDEFCRGIPNVSCCLSLRVARSFMFRGISLFFSDG